MAKWWRVCTTSWYNCFGYPIRSNPSTRLISFVDRSALLWLDSDRHLCICVCIWGVPGACCTWYTRPSLEQWAGTKNVAELRSTSRLFMQTQMGYQKVSNLSVAIGTSKKNYQEPVIFGEKSGIHEFRIRTEFPFIAFSPNPSSISAKRNTNPIRSKCK